MILYKTSVLISKESESEGHNSVTYSTSTSEIKRQNLSPPKLTTAEDGPFFDELNPNFPLDSNWFCTSTKRLVTNYGPDPLCIVYYSLKRLLLEDSSK